MVIAMGRPKKSDREGQEDPRELILRSARAEIEKNGILGLRVAEVAANAHYSVSIIYRYFGDRDGLLAQVLGDLYEEILERVSGKMAESLPSTGPLSIEQVIALAPRPSQAYGQSDMRLRLQILAVAATNPLLEDRLKAIAQQRYSLMREWIADITSRLPADQPFDGRVVLVMIVNQLLYYNTLLGDQAVTDDEYLAFIRDVATMKRG